MKFIKREDLHKHAIVCLCSIVLVLSVLPFILDRHFFPFLNPVMFASVHLEPTQRLLTFKTEDNHELDNDHPFFSPRRGYAFTSTIWFHVDGRNLDDPKIQNRLEKILTAKLRSANSRIGQNIYKGSKAFEPASVLNVYLREIWIDRMGRLDPVKSKEKYLFQIRDESNG